MCSLFAVVLASHIVLLVITSFIFLLDPVHFRQYDHNSLEDLPDLPDEYFIRICEEDLRQSLCNNDERVSRVQRVLWIKTWAELFPNIPNNAIEHNMSFYQEAYGTEELKLPSNPLNYTILAYYRIYKVGNDNIRSFLYEYAYKATNNTAQYYARGCPACKHPWVRKGHMSELRLRLAPYSGRRFAFTFVRHPLVRFISAMNEIEYRVHGNRVKEDMLGLAKPIGSMERVMEFIERIVKTGGAQQSFREMEDIEFGHIAPMHGTFALARKLEPVPMHLYRLEAIGTEWKRLSKEVRDPLLLHIFQGRKKRKEWFVHASASDPLHVTTAALSLFSIAASDLFEQNILKGKGNISLFPINKWSNASVYVSHSHRYLRAVCRIYFIDFLCANYSLPEACWSIYGEAEEAMG